jgi:hypothetical protein
MSAYEDSTAVKRGEGAGRGGAVAVDGSWSAHIHTLDQELARSVQRQLSLQVGGGYGYQHGNDDNSSANPSSGAAAAASGAAAAAGGSTGMILPRWVDMTAADLAGGKAGAYTRPLLSST